MSEKELKVRIQQKHDIEANWIKATNFVPKAGEIIIYDADDIHLQPRIKIGNGIAAVNDLDFVDSTDPTVPAWAKADTKPSYTKSEVGLSNVDNIQQYSANNPPVVVQGSAPSDTNLLWIDPNENSLAYIPVKGIDYWTEADQEAIIQQVITTLGTPVFGRVDVNNNIILTGNLADGAYTLKYEDADGNVTEIGTLEQGASYINLADPTSADWLTNKRLNSSGVVTDTTPSLTTNYIPVKMGDIVRIRYMNIYNQGSGTSNATTHFYDADKNRVASVTPATSDTTQYFVRDADGLGCTFNMTKVSTLFNIVSGTTSDIRYARFSGKLYDGYTKDDVIITVNQEITE